MMSLECSRQMLPGGMATVTASMVPHHYHEHAPHRLARLPPPDVAELPRGYATLPHPSATSHAQPVAVASARSSSVADATGTSPLPPPPPKAPNMAVVPQVPVMPSSAISGVPMEHLDSGVTLEKRPGLGADMLQGHNPQHNLHIQHTRMEEFRV